METTSAAAPQTATGGRRHGSGVSGGADKRIHLKWIAAFETGSSEIDALHRELVQDCSGLLLLVENNAAWPLIVAEATRLVESCVAHFRLEEMLLEQTRFPRRLEHLAEHRRLERDLGNLIEQMKRVNGSLKEHHDIPRSLGPTLVDLIVRHDLDFRSHLLRQQEK